MTELFIRYLHFLAIFGLFSLLILEHALLKSELTAHELKRLTTIDMLYGISATAVLFLGLTLWLWVGKPASFYTSNPMFHAKLGAFVLVGLLSIRPTLFFIKQRNTEKTSIQVPADITWIIRVELLILLIIPLLAVLMARGIGAN